MKTVFLHKVEANLSARKPGYREAVYAKAIRVVEDAEPPFLEMEDEDFEAIRNEFTTAVLPKFINPPCAHRGGHVGESLCRTCSGSVRVKVFECAVHGRCTVQKPVNGAATCTGCKDRREELPPADRVQP